MTRPTRVLLAITELRPAGAERVVYDIATRLPPERFDVQVCSLTSSRGDDGAVARQLETAGIPVVSVRMRHKFDVFGARRFAKVVRTFRPHILHAHLFHANLAARVLGRRSGAARIVSTIHIVERRPLRWRRLLERRTAQRDDVTVCVSDAVAQHAREALGVREPRVIPNGIDVDRFSVLPRRESARQALGLPVEGRLVGAVGRLSRQKGLDDLLAAFATIAAGDASVSLVIAGEGEEEAALRQTARTLGVEARTHFLGFREDVPGVLAALDVFCMPSRWEGFGLSMVEAMAAGLPVVASRVDSLPEILGDAGVLVPPDDPSSLAAAIDSILADQVLARGLGDNGRERARDYSVERMVAAYEGLYVELAPMDRV